MTWVVVWVVRAVMAVCTVGLVFLAYDAWTYYWLNGLVVTLIAGAILGFGWYAVLEDIDA